MAKLQAEVGQKAVELRTQEVLKNFERTTNIFTVPVQNLSLIGKLSSSTTVIQRLQKEHLLEKYLHTDNMSTEEKMTIELAKARYEFKISESDCKSAHVQVVLSCLTDQYLMVRQRQYWLLKRFFLPS